METPLADLIRPESLEDYFGQKHILEKGLPLRTELESGSVHSMILWGPPGTGKTTLAHIISKQTESAFIPLSAVLSGVKDIRQAVIEAEKNREEGKQTILFVDEVHRFNKSQQDAFLPHIESGLFVFIGATTENPSFELNNALLSRCSVYVLNTLDDEALQQVFERANNKLIDFGFAFISLENDALEYLKNISDGDARRFLNTLEMVLKQGDISGLTFGLEEIKQLAQQHYRSLGKKGDVFYDQISALHKSVRGSDPDAALYWMCRMLDGGCDPLYISRRLIRMASEDIGNADPRAIQLAIQSDHSYRTLGSPEGELALAQCVLYLASCAKSNAAYIAYKQAMQDVKKGKAYEVPNHLRNAPTRLMKNIGMGQGYRYAHDEAEGFAAGETYFPAELVGTRYYEPVDRGLESKIKQRLDYLRGLNEKP